MSAGRYEVSVPGNDPLVLMPRNGRATFWVCGRMYASPPVPAPMKAKFVPLGATTRADAGR